MVESTDAAGTVTQIFFHQDLPRAGLVLSFSALMVSVVYALPAWLGVRR